MKKNKLWIILVLLAIVFSLAFALIFFNNSSKKNDDQVIETISVEKSASLNFTGISKSKNVQYLNFNQQLGETIFLEIQDGSEVSKGDLIASYYSLEVNNSLIDHENKVSQKQEEIETLKHNENGDSEKIATLSNEIEQLEKDIKTLETYAVAKIYSSFDGLFTANLGANYEAGEVLGKIMSKEMDVEIEVSEYDLEKLEKNMTIQLTYVNKSEKVDGVINHISKLSENTTSKVSSYLATITPSENIPNGYHVQVSIPMNEIKVPLTSVKIEEQKAYVYKSSGEKFEKIEVEVDETDHYYIIKNGIKEKDTIAKNTEDVFKKDVLIE
jgi:HlyD family secretion protein